MILRIVLWLYLRKLTQKLMIKIKSLLLSCKRNTLLNIRYANFTGKTESKFKFKTPKLRARILTPIYPSPGYNLEIPGICFNT
jgi:hypothetical protein